MEKKAKQMIITRLIANFDENVHIFIDFVLTKSMRIPIVKRGIYFSLHSSHFWSLNKSSLLKTSIHH